MEDKVLAIMQARMASTRLPGKMLLPVIDGKGCLELMLERVSRAKTLDKIVVATTTSSSDDKLADLCKRLGYDCFRGDEDDVLDRFYRAALAFGPVDIIVRLTGDCPLHDAAVIDRVVLEFRKSCKDFGCNNFPPTYPDGLDVEIFSFAVLEKAWKEAELKSEREHVRMYMCNHPEMFSTISVAREKDLSDKRWTLDEKEDYEFIKRIYKMLYKKNPAFTSEDVLELLAAHPQLEEINRHVGRDEGLQKSLREDEISDLSNRRKQ